MTRLPENKLAKIARALGVGTPTHAGHNLLGAYLDLKRTKKVDWICLRTIERVIKQLGRVEAILKSGR